MICRLIQRFNAPASYQFSAIQPTDSNSASSINEMLVLKKTNDGESFNLERSEVITSTSQKILTDTQRVAVNSGITNTKVKTYDDYAAKITAAQTTAVDAATAASAAQSTADSKQDALSVESPITLDGSTLGFASPAANTQDTDGDLTAWREGSTFIDNSGAFSHAEGYENEASGEASHAEGGSTTADGANSHAEGGSTTASGEASHTEGDSTAADGDYSHAEGYRTAASGEASHAEGDSTAASGEASHAEGYSTTAGGYASHAEGGSTTADGGSSHAEGYYTYADGFAKHAGGMYNARETTDWAASTAYAVGDRVVANYNNVYICTTAHTSGSTFSSTNWQAEDVTHRGKYAFVIGNGTSNTARSNAVAVDWEGTSWVAGDVTCDAAQGNHDNIYSMRAIGAVVASTPTITYGTSNSITVGANAHALVDVTFPATLTEVPVVFPAIQCATAGVNLIATVQSVSNTQASICVTNLGTTDVSDVTVDYMALSGR